MVSFQGNQRRRCTPLQTIELQAQRRTAGKARRLRREGLVPAVIYGRDQEPQPIALPAPQVMRLLNSGAHGVIQITVDGDDGGQAENVMIREVQQDPIRGDIIHMDFLRVSMTDKVQTTLPITLAGEDALPSGGVLQQLLYEVDVEGLPGAIPDAIIVDVAGLAVGDSIAVANLAPPEGVAVLTDPEQVVVQLAAVRRAAAEPGADDAGDASPDAEAAQEDDGGQD